MNISASLQHLCRRGANGLTYKTANSPLCALIPVVLCGLLLSVVPASGQQVNLINTIAGGGTVNSNPASADIPGPTSAVEDGKGNLYIAAPSSQYVFEMSAGVVTQFAGAGYIGFHGNGLANTEPVWNPYGLAVDGQGNIYIADTNNNLVRKVDTSGNMTNVAGTSKPCYQTRCGDGGSALKALLNAPQGVVLDASGNIYIADTGDNRIRVVRTNGNIYPFAGNFNVSPCSNPTSPCGDGGAAVQASLNAPVGLAVDSKGNLYISDTGDNRVRVVNKKTRVINAFAGNGTSCAPAWNPCGDTGAALQANLGAPRGLSIDSSLNVYIADTRDQRIRIVSSAGTINTFAGTGHHGFTGDGGSPTAAQLAGPNGVFVDSAGNVFISDTGNQRVREVTAGVINTILGGGNGGDGGGPTGAQFANPTGVALDSSGNYYIADTNNNRIRVVSGNSLQTVAGNGLIGYTGDGGSALAAELNAPLGVAVDGSGNIFIADTYNKVVREVSGGNINTFAGNGAPCSPSTGSCGDGGPAINANLTSPYSMAVDSSGNVFIADAFSQKVREVSHGIITTIAGTGTANYSGDGGPATAAELKNPTGVAVDSSENVYIADSRNNRIRCVLGVVGGCGDLQHKYAVGDIITYAYNGAIGFQGDGGPAINASRWNPTQVALDSQGNLFIGGGNNELVQRVDLVTGIIVTVAGDDKAWWFYGFRGDGGPANKAQIDNAGLAIDSNESLYIADAGNNRIRQVANMVPVATLKPKSINFGSVPVGQQSQPVNVTLTNTGANDLSLSSFGTAGDFSQTNQCPAMLAPSQSCIIAVTFTPTKKGARSGKLQVTDNAPLSPQGVRLAGTGT